MVDNFLMDSLRSLLKEDLFKILAHFEVKIAKSSVKNILVEKICEIYNSNPSYFLNFFSKESITFLSQYDESNNQINETDLLNNQELLAPLQQFGFISKNVVKGTKYYNISTWFLNLIKVDNNQEITTKPTTSSDVTPNPINDELNLVALGIIQFYGVISEEKLIEILSKKNIETTLNEIYSFYNTEWQTNKAISTFSNPEDNTVYFVSKTVESPAKIISLSTQCSGIDYKLLTVEEYKLYATYSFVGKDNIVQNLFRFLSMYNLNESQIAVEFTSIINKIKNHITIRDIMADFNSRFSFKNFELGRIFITMITHFNNTVPLWALKGHSRADFNAEDPVPSLKRVVDKVGRNEPCPCKSGKKYKKCCGKNN